LTKNRIRLSFLSKKQAAELASRSGIDHIKPGDFVQGSVRKILTNTVDNETSVSGYVLDILENHDAKKSLIGRLDFHHLSDHPSACDALSEALKVGSKISDLVVLERLDSIGQLKLTRKKSIREAIEEGDISDKIQDLKKGSTVPGYVASVTPNAVFVRFLGHLTGRAGLAQLSDSFVADPNLLYHVGMSVRALITDIDAKDEKISLSLKPSLCGCPGGSLLKCLFEDSELANKINVDNDPSSAVTWEDSFQFGASSRSSFHSWLHIVDDV